MDKLEKRLPLRLSQKAYEQLKELSRLHDGNVTQTAREAIKHYYKAKRKQLKEMEG